MRETINLKPAGLETPEGEQRVAKAHKAFEESHAIVANAATVFLNKYAAEIRVVLLQYGEDAVEDLNELEQIIERRDDAQDEFLRAMANHPPRKVV